LTHPLRGLRHLRGYTLRQGRYENLIVEEDSYLGGLQHYVNLNPVRAAMCHFETLNNYRCPKFWSFNHPRNRPSFLNLSSALDHAGGLKDASAGRRKYMEYLS